MARGGVRPNAGRKPGAATKRTREIADKAAADGVTPLDVMLGTMRAMWESANQGGVINAEVAAQASAIAKDAAPYVHPRLSSIEANVRTSVDPRDMSDDELAAIAAGGSTGASA